MTLALKCINFAVRKGPRDGPQCKIPLMKQQKEVKISSWAVHATTGVSVSLALFTLGLLALLWIAATSESRRLLEKIEVSVIIADNVSEDRAIAISDSVKLLPFAKNVRYISSAGALANWKASTGEDLEAVFGVNPLSPEVAFSLGSEYSSSEAIAKIKKQLSEIRGVADVATPDNDLIESMNSNIRRLSLGFAILAAILLVISFVLINNTVRLSIYSRRFSIHTMQLVGATNAFIRRPFIAVNALTGGVSGLIAGAVLAGMLLLLPQSGIEGAASLIGWGWMGIVAAALIIIGASTCGLAAALATTRHLRQDYEELFK